VTAVAQSTLPDWNVCDTVVPPFVWLYVTSGEPSPKFHVNWVVALIWVELLKNSRVAGAHAWVTPPKGIWIEAFVGCSTMCVPSTVQVPCMNRTV
jgi:hypothetical protein